MSKTGWKKMPEEVRFASILEAAACCFMEKGYHSASMQDVAKAAGLTKGGLYHHFASKEAIRDALLTQFLDLDRMGLRTLVADTMPADKKLRRAGELLLEGLATKHGSAPRFMAEAVACSGAVDAVTDFYQGVAAVMVALFQEAQKTGVIKSVVGAKTLATLYIALLDGIQIRKDISGEMPTENPLSSFIDTLKV